MNPVSAKRFARQSHAGQRNRFGERIIDHLERVAGALPEDARALGYLHDVLEQSDTTVNELRAIGVTDVEATALELLTHDPQETYEAYVRRIASAGGEPGRLARMVKLVDLDDHLRQPTIPRSAPNYQWARQQIATGQRRRHEDSSVTNRPTKVDVSGRAPRRRSTRPRRRNQLKANVPELATPPSNPVAAEAIG